MSEPLHWTVADGCLILSGELDHQTLLPLWQQRGSLVEQIKQVDVAGLSHVDTAGLAVLVHLRHGAAEKNEELSFFGITEKLSSLIRLYNLQYLINFVE